MNYNICLFLPSNFFIIMTDNLEFTIEQLIKFDQLINQSDYSNYQGILIFMNDGIFSHYQLISTNLELNELNEINLLDELLSLLELEDLDNLKDLNTISTIQKKIGEEGEYSSYKVKYDYDFNEHIYKKVTNINHELDFLIHIFHQHILH